jgi:hypothetical protein
MSNTTSLYTVGFNKIEVGRYGGDVQRALDLFLQTAETAGFQRAELDVQWNEENVSVTVDLPELDERNLVLLEAVADIADLHCDAPETYVLESAQSTDGEYVRTGSYFD